MAQEQETQRKFFKMVSGEGRKPGLEGPKNAILRQPQQANCWELDKPHPGTAGMSAKEAKEPKKEKQDEADGIGT